MLRVLHIEDVEDDAKLVELELRRGGWAPRCHRVDTAPAMRAALAGSVWDLVISDFGLPAFDAPSALSVLQELGTDVPFIIVSGTITEEAAVAAMKAGAHDYITKSNLRRLVPVVRRELREAEVRREHRAADERRREAEARFRTLVESHDGIVFTVDERGVLDGVFGRGLGQSARAVDAWLGRPLAAVVGGSAAAAQAVCARAFAGERVEIEWIREPGPAAQYLHLSLSPIAMDDGVVRGLCGLVRDVTDERRTQTRLLEADRLASIGTLAAGVGHEINNPLAALLANLEVVERELHTLGGEPSIAATLARVQAGLADVREAAERVRQVSRDLRVVSRTTDERREPVSLEQVLESSIRMAWNDIRHRARLVRAYEPAPPVYASEARLGQVFLNLLINATQAIPAGDAEAQTIRVTVRPEGAEVLVEIADSGPGIPPAVQARLFTPFFTTKAEGLGTGLGLSICQRIVTGLGGSISVDSVPGRGATFRVRLPAAPESEAAIALPPAALAPAAAPRARALRRARVLVVDDEAIIRRAMQRTLEDAHDVTGVGSGREALALIEGGARFDVIFCDLMMPEMGGIELYAALNAVAPAQARVIVFLTGGAFTEGGRACVESVANPVLEKPFDTHQLVDLVATYAGGSGHS
jgi:C4-dicarboxylate-specific signal transduction histidine kinase